MAKILKVAVWGVWGILHLWVRKREPGKKKSLIYPTSLMMRGTCTISMHTISMHNLLQRLSLVNYWFRRQLTLK
jgi:hypothetical protein